MNNKLNVFKFFQKLFVNGCDGTNLYFENGEAKLQLDTDGSAMKFIKDNYPFHISIAKYHSEKFHIYERFSAPYGIELLVDDDHNDEYFQSNKDIYNYWDYFVSDLFCGIDEDEVYEQVLEDLKDYNPSENLIIDFINKFPHVIPEEFDTSKYITLN